MTNEFFTTSNFIRKYGFDKFKRFSQMMNDGCSLKEMSAELGLSMSQLSRYRDAMFDIRYVPKVGTDRYLKEYSYLDQYRSEQKEEFRLVLLKGVK